MISVSGKKWLPTPVYLPRDSHGQMSLEGYSPGGFERVRHNLANNNHTITATYIDIEASSEEFIFLTKNEEEI